MLHHSHCIINASDANTAAVTVFFVFLRIKTFGMVRWLVGKSSSHATWKPELDP